MNYLWGGMIVIGVVYAILTGNLDAVTEQALVSAKEAISLCITMAGAMAFWVGIMRIAERAGMIERAAQKMGPILTFLFPSVPKSGRARTQIATNMVANVLGLGWAATPAGLKAMEALGELEEDRRLGRAFGPVRKRGVAGDEMCIFLILNISSLQLIPVNVIAYRSQYGSADPAGIIGGGILATMASTGAAVVYVLVMQRWGKRK